VIFLWLPVATLVLFILVLTAFCAFPLSWVGDFFGNQPQYEPGEQGAFDIGLLLACYLVTYGLLSLWRGCWPWLKVTAGVCVALVAGGVVFAAQFGEAISGRRGDTPLLLWPFIAYEKLAYPATSGLREGHYLRHLGDADERFRSIAGSACSRIRPLCVGPSRIFSTTMTWTRLTNPRMKTSRGEPGICT